MIDYYQTDSMGVFAGAVQVSPFDPLPPGTLTPPPDTTGTEVAQLQGAQWVVLPGYPPAPTPEIAVPQSVSMRQARLALLTVNLLDDVEAAVAASGRAAQIEWEYATEVQRTHPLIAAAQQAQGLTDADIDALFSAAAEM